MQKSIDEDSDYYVYVHYRLDSKKPFYVGKGRWNRARQKTNRGRKWHEVCAEAGGFTVGFIAKGMTDSAAKALEWQKIDEMKDILVNAHKAPSLVSQRRSKTMVTMTLDADLLAKLRGWAAEQTPKRPFNGVLQQAITEYLDFVGA